MTGLTGANVQQVARWEPRSHPHDEHDHGKATPHKAEGTRCDDGDELSSKKGNVTVGNNPDKAEGTPENVEASLRKQEREQDEKRK